MRLEPSDALLLLQKPANTALLQKGRDLEKRHRLHILGEDKLLKEFLTKHTTVESQETYESRLRVTPPATKPIYAQIRNVLSKVFSAYGTNFGFTFSTPELKADFLDYLDEKDRYGQTLIEHLEDLYSKKSVFGFQGLFLVDMPSELPRGLNVPPEPYVAYVASASLHDMLIQGNKVEYCILISGEGEEKRYLVVADNAYLTYKRSNDKQGFELVAILDNTLGYVPACPVTSFTEDSETSTTRTSILAPSIELADVFLRDFSEHELNKLFHAFAQKWSYGVPCDNEEEYEGSMIACDGGWLSWYVGDVNHRAKCKKCNGMGKYVPVGPDKTFLITVPESGKDAFDVRPPAGYIVPDIESIQYLYTCVQNGEDAIEKASIGVEGYLAKTTKIETATEKELDMEPIKATLNRFKKDLEFVVKFCLDTIAKLRYEKAFQASSIHYGNKYFLKSIAEAEADYKTAKEAGVPAPILFDYLEEIILIRHRDDPVALEENLIKLCLTPFPTMTELEFGMAAYISQDDKTLRAYLNDYLERFEQENGELSLFGSLLPKEQRIAKIKAIITGYNAEKLKTIVPPEPKAPIPA
jgi:hypothetical protein